MKNPASELTVALGCEKIQNFRVVVYLLSWAVPAMLMFIGIIAGLHIIIAGEKALGTSDLVPWGLLIAGYVLLAVTCSGLCITISLGHVLLIKNLHFVGQRAIFLAITVLISGFAVLAVELGHPLRLVYVLFSPNFKSGIFWMGTIYGIYLVALIVELVMYQLQKYSLSKIMAIVTLILAIAATSNLGAVFGLVNARLFWNGPYWSIYILMTAIMSGLSALAILAWLLQRNARGYRGDQLRAIITTVSKGLTVLLVCTGVLTFWKVTTSLSGGIPAQRLAALSLLQGPLAIPFWVFEVGLGILMPLVLIIVGRGKRLTYIVGAAVTSLLGIIFMRYNMVIAGQIVPVDNLVVNVQFTGFTHYLPSASEVLVLIGAIGFIILANRIGGLLLQLD